MLFKIKISPRFPDYKSAPDKNDMQPVTLNGHMVTKIGIGVYLRVISGDASMNSNNHVIVRTTGDDNSPLRTIYSDISNDIGFKWGTAIRNYVFEYHSKDQYTYSKVDDKNKIFNNP